MPPKLNGRDGKLASTAFGPSAPGRKGARHTSPQRSGGKSSSSETIDMGKLEHALTGLNIASRSVVSHTSSAKKSAAPAASARGRTALGRRQENGSVRQFHTSFSVFSLHTPEDIARALGAGHFRQVVCMVGAGISTPSGIPDFRTKGTGLYDNLAKFKLPEPEAVFDLDFYLRNPMPFVQLAKDLYPGLYEPNTSHHFMRLLHDKKVLRRVYTQNIDGLERLAGVPAEKLVEAHGTFSSASCTGCHRSQDPAAVKAMIMASKRPSCVYCKALVKPDVVFFGEDLPERFYRMYRTDLKSCDLLLVMGTSLRVEPFAGLVDEVRSGTPRLLLNRELVGPFCRRRARRTGAVPDMALQGDIVTELRQFCHACSWTSSLQALDGGGSGAAGADPEPVPVATPSLVPGAARTEAEKAEPQDGTAASETLDTSTADDAPPDGENT